MNNGYTMLSGPSLNGLIDVNADSITSSTVSTDKIYIDGVDVGTSLSQIPINANNITALQQITTGQTYVSGTDTTTFDNNVSINNNLLVGGVNVSSAITTLQQITTGQTYVSGTDTTTIDNNVIISGTLSATGNILEPTITANTLIISPAELSCLDSIGSNIQTQLNNKVGLTGTETINGVKTFGSVPICTTNATTSSQLTNKAYVDGATSSIQAQINAFPAVANIVTTNTTQTITGDKTFSGTTNLATTNITGTCIFPAGSTTWFNNNFLVTANALGTATCLRLTTQGSQTFIQGGATSGSGTADIVFSSIYSATAWATMSSTGLAMNNTNITLGASSNLILTTPSITLTPTELSYLDGATSNIQAQINAFPTPANIVTTNTTQTISAAKTFDGVTTTFQTNAFSPNTTVSIRDTGTTNTINFYPNAGVGAFNFLTQAGDTLILAGNNALEVTNLTIAPYSNVLSGIRITPFTTFIGVGGVGTTTTRTAGITCSGTTVTVTGTLSVANITGLTSITPSNSKSVLFNGTPIGNGGNTSSVCMGTNAGPVGTAPNNCFCFGTNAGANLTSGVQNLFIGANSGSSVSSGRSNVGVGPSAMRKTTIGTYNTQIGAQSQSFPDENLTGSYNTTIGAECYIAVDGLSYSTAIGAGVVASTSNTVQIGRAADNTIFDGTVNVVGDAIFDKNNILTAAGSVNIGCGAGSTVSNLVCGNTNAKSVVFTSGNNTVLGGNAGNAMTIAATSNTYVGSSSGSGATSSVQNTCVGSGAGQGITTGLGANVFVGYLSGFQTANGTGSNNVCIGALAGTAMTTTANSNVMVGSLAGYNVNTGARNVLLGGAAGDAITNGNDNTIVGDSAGSALLTGVRNTIVGASSGTTITGSDNICIGSGASVPTAANSNQIAIGRVNETMYIRGGFNLRIGSQITNSTNGNLSAAGFVLAQFYIVNPAGAGVVIALPNPTNAAYIGAMVTFKRKQVTTAFSISSGGSISFVPIGAVALTASPIAIGTATFQVTLVSDGVNWCIINQA